ncbi:flagellar hook basal-body protein (plasmid) [Erythrobacter aureus]|uniref:Flagellar basal-body rod protein FlgF n=1 Tax=Erythrobacter aureus TaxID=2182384 RepID=A0A345YJN9_9SPHN|nr:flagellar hook basal-body protein [Erythrobacter aureus]AXK44141.1 flagellar hook basal-body protein [Erythrobacter aureus]
MDNSGFVLLSHSQALRRRMDVVANNMANLSTVGFKAERPVFHEFVERADSALVDDAKETSFVLDFRAIHDMSDGAFQPTGNPLDVMIEGPGYLGVELPNGDTAYTRAGFVHVLENGDLATPGGQPLLDEAGQRINVPPEQSAQLSIAADGSVMAGEDVVGRLAVTVFDDETNLTPRGDNTYAGALGRVLGAEETKLRSGGVEGSNVQAIRETTNMIEIQRAYQTGINMTESVGEMRKRAIDRLGRVG